MINAQAMSPDEIRTAVARMDAGVEVLRDYVEQRKARGWQVAECAVRQRDGMFYGHVTVGYDGHAETFDVSLDSMIDDYLTAVGKRGENGN